MELIAIYKQAVNQAILEKAGPLRAPVLRRLPEDCCERLSGLRI